MISNAQFTMNLTTTVPSLVNTTYCTNCSLSTTLSSEETTSTEPNETLLLVEKCVLSIILAACLFGNILLITAILFFKRLRREGNYFILNLACCDIITAVFSIPFTIVLAESKSFPFGEVGCKIISPLATYGSNASVLTLVCIAIERFVAISGYNFRFTMKKITALIALVHMISLMLATPYAYHLKFELYQGANYCYEDWYGTNAQKRYTITLFLVQYGLPLPVLIVLYSSAWWKINKQNNKMIKMSEEYERKMAWNTEIPVHGAGDKIKSSTENDGVGRKLTTETIHEESNRNSQVSNSLYIEEKDNRKQSKNSRVSFVQDAAQTGQRNSDVIIENDLNHNNTETPYVKRKRTLSRASIQATLQRSDTLRTIRQKINTFRKPAFASQTASVRYRQTVRTLTMFTTVLIVFLVFALPNQIIWLMKDFSPNRRIGAEFTLVFNFLTYVNSVVNCWIYGGFNKGFRKAYRYLLTCGRSGNEKSDGKTTITTVPSSYYDEEKRDQFESRNNAFTEMFQQHFNNFDQFQHLYEHDEEQEELLQQQQQKSKRKFSIVHILNAITPASRKNSMLSLSSQTGKNRQYSLIPPILPFAQAAGNMKTHTIRRSSSSSITKTPERKFSLQSLPVALTPTLLSPEVTSYISTRHRRSSSPGMYRPQQKNHIWNTISPDHKKQSIENNIELLAIKRVPSEDQHIFVSTDDILTKQKSDIQPTTDGITERLKTTSECYAMTSQNGSAGNLEENTTTDLNTSSEESPVRTTDTLDSELMITDNADTANNHIPSDKQDCRNHLNKNTPIVNGRIIKSLQHSSSNGTSKISFNPSKRVDTPTVRAEKLKQHSKSFDESKSVSNTRTRKQSVYTLSVEQDILKPILEDVEPKQNPVRTREPVRIYSRRTRLSQHVFGNVTGKV